MKVRNIFYVFFIGCVIFLTAFVLSNNKTYSYGILKQIKTINNAKIIEYIDTDTGSSISFNDAKKYFGVSTYEELYENGNIIYFKEGKEINHQEFIKGKSSEQADELASLYGKNAYRVHTTAEFLHAFDDIYQNLKIGEFHIAFSKYEAIDFDQVATYYQNTYGVKSYYQNYYNYQTKGMWEPNRFGINLNNAINNGELVLTTTNIRLSGNERVVVEDFVNKLLPYIQGNGSDYEKILATYTYIIKTTSYIVDNGFTNDLLASNTSVYDALISRKTTCIGYSITFSYIMDKLGIESYIVDQITEADEATGSFASVHTYNVVKLNNQFYKIDLTGNIFLGGLNNNELYDNNLNISTTKYNGTMNINIDFAIIDNILNSSKNIKTTTTRKAEATTTTKTYSYSIPNGKISTTTKKANSNNSTADIKTSIVTTKDSEGNIVTMPVEIDNNGEIITKESGEYQEVTNVPNDKDNKKKKTFNYNFILFPLLFIGIITLILLKLKDKGIIGNKKINKFKRR